MAKKTVRTVTAVLLAAVLALSACARGDESDAGGGDDTGDAGALFTPGFHEADPPGEPTSGGTLTFADFAETRSLDPTRNLYTGYSAGTVMTALYDPLIRWNQREQAFEPRLAESVESNDDHTEWTITLREGAEFSDGSPVDADAVLGSFAYYLENQGSDLGVVGPQWGGAEKVDDRTVRVTLRQGWATFPFALGMGIGFIVAPAAIADGPEGFRPIGAGAFTFESYRPQEELVLTANPNYWDGAPHLDQLRFVWLGADETKLESLDGGTVQGAIVRDSRVVERALTADVSGWVSVESFGRIIMINRAEGRPAAEYPQIAEAIAHAIDGEELTDRVFDGVGMPSRHVFGPASRWHNEDAEVRELDRQKATELLDEAKGGRLRRHGGTDQHG